MRYRTVPYLYGTVPSGRSRNKQTETVLLHILQKQYENKSYERERERERERARERERE